MNRDTETLFYNIRMIIDSKVETEPRAWLISKVNRISPNGIARVTLTQDIFDEHKDYIEKDKDGNIIGMWANYYIDNIAPTPVPIDDESTTPSSITSVVTCSGKKQMRIGGSVKTFTATYYDEDGEVVDMSPEGWSFLIDGETAPNILFDFTTDGNKIKLKFAGDETYIGKILTIISTSGDITSSLDVEIMAL